MVLNGWVFYVGYQLKRQSDYPLGFGARQAPHPIELKFVKFLPAKWEIGKDLGCSAPF